MFQHNHPLKDLNTFHMDVQAEHFAAFSRIEQLREILHEINTDEGHKQPRMILGGGSNVLFTGDVKGYLLKNDIAGISLVSEDNDYVYLKAGAGVNWHSFVMHCIDQGYAGAENLALIPGNVGASPMQNIGAYGVELKDIFHELEAIEWNTGESVVFRLHDCAFGYRESVFKHTYRNRFIICSVTYRLRKKPVFHTSYGAIQEELDRMNVSELSIRSIAEAVIRIRRSKLPDPAVIGNAGSFFKNPEVEKEVFQELKQKFPSMVGYETATGHIKLAAGWLIEHCGPQPGTSWKGYRLGDAGCHERQALVLVNHGHATGAEIQALSQQIQASVLSGFGVRLQAEVNVY